MPVWLWRCWSTNHMITKWMLIDLALWCGMLLFYFPDAKRSWWCDKLAMEQIISLELYSAIWHYWSWGCYFSCADAWFPMPVHALLHLWMGRCWLVGFHMMVLHTTASSNWCCATVQLSLFHLVVWSCWQFVKIPFWCPCCCVRVFPDFALCITLLSRLRLRDEREQSIWWKNVLLQTGLRPEIPPFVPEQCWHQHPKQQPEFSKYLLLFSNFWHYWVLS
jgi:hypothetical protein